jgi:hypothetical protein
MTAPVLAWGPEQAFDVPSIEGHVYGREFELLPAGTMFAAGSLLSGVIGVTETGSQVVITGYRATMGRELEGYRDDIVTAYRVRQGQG